MSSNESGDKGRSLKKKKRIKGPELHHKLKIWFCLMAYAATLICLSLYYRIWWDWPGLKVGCAVLLTVIPMIPVMILGLHTETRWSEEERMKRRGIKGITRYDKGTTIKYMWFTKWTALFFLLSLTPLLQSKVPENVLYWIEGLQGFLAVIYALFLLVAVYIDKEDPSKEQVRWIFIYIGIFVLLVFGVGAWAFLSDSIRAFPKSFLPMGYLIVIHPYVLIRLIYWLKGQFKFIVVEPGRIYVKGLGTEESPDMEFTRETSEVKFSHDDPLEEKFLNVGNEHWKGYAPDEEDTSKRKLVWELVVRSGQFQKTKNSIQSIRSQQAVAVIQS